MTQIRLRNRDFTPTRHSHHGMDDMFNWFLNENTSFGECNDHPSANISETDNDFKIEMLVPGYKKENISIQFEKGVLSVKHENEENREEASEKFISREFYTRNFNRRFKLSDRLASEKIIAKYENGVLVISIPKKEEAKAKPVQEISIN